MTDPLIEAENLTIQYQTARGPLTAVSNASFEISNGEFFGLAGESGSGKSTIAKAIIGGLDANGHIADGVIRYDGQEIQDYSERQLNQELRWKEISWIPQGSMNSLDPLQQIGDQAVEIAQTHTDLEEDEALDRFAEMFEVVGLQESRITDYPHQFSGGMQQRAIIALALFLEPSLVIADEPTTALDVIMQDQIFKHLDKLQDALDISLLLITHDISLIFESCDRMALMHAGQIAESGQVSDLHSSPRHPYTILFKEAFPDVRYPGRDLEIIQGHPPELIGDVDFCSFADRCPWAVDECREQEPILESIEDSGEDHYAACFRREEAADLYEQRQTEVENHTQEQR